MKQHNNYKMVEHYKRQLNKKQQKKQELEQEIKQTRQIFEDSDNIINKSEIEISVNSIDELDEYLSSRRKQDKFEEYKNWYYKIYDDMQISLTSCEDKIIKIPSVFLSYLNTNGINILTSKRRFKYSHNTLKYIKKIICNEFKSYNVKYINSFELEAARSEFSLKKIYDFWITHRYIQKIMLNEEEKNYKRELKQYLKQYLRELKEKEIDDAYDNYYSGITNFEKNVGDYQTYDEFTKNFNL